jgi:predicted MFS family arabinose efflux permease
VTPESTPVSQSERAIILLVAAVQFVNVLDFMMVMPLGPDFAKGLGIPTSELGLIASSYAFAAALSGFVGAAFLDRFDRRKALAVAISGLVAATAAGAMAQGLWTMVAARFLAGAFGGPSTAIALAIVADVVPPQRRGRAMSTVMGAFSVASSIGVPLGLALSYVAGWRFPFLAVAGLGVVVIILAMQRMPSMTGHLGGKAAMGPYDRMRALLTDSTVRLALLTNALVFFTAFLVIPNIAPHLIQNLGYPRPRLSWAYAVGGVSSIFVLFFAGRAVDRRGPTFVSLVGTTVFVAALLFGFIVPERYFHLPVFILFIIFMAAMSTRNLSMGSLSTRVPKNFERAGFMSLQSMAQQLSSGLGAFLSSRMLHDTADGRLTGIDTVSTLALVFGLSLPPLLAVIMRRVRVREAAAPPAPGPAQAQPAT